MLKSGLFTFLCFSIIPFLLPAQQDNSAFTKKRAGNFLKTKTVKFIENAGQLKDFSNKPIPSVLFKASLPGLDLYITQKGLTYVSYMIQNKTSADKNPDLQIKMPEASLNWERLDMQLSGARIRKENIIKEQADEIEYNYYLAHCPDGIKHIKQYGRVTINDIYKGIDWVLYNTGNTGFEYDFIVHPGADPKQIKMLYSSAQPLATDHKGNLLLMDHSESGSLSENAPISYIKESREKVNSHFKILYSEKKKYHFECLVGIDLENTRANLLQTLVIDPQLVWATTIGGSANEGIASIDTDVNDNVFITGLTQSANFPTQNSGSYFQGSWNGNPSYSTIFVSKFNSSGALIWSTYYNGSYIDRAYSVAVDSLQNIIVIGNTYSSDFPLQNNGTFFQGTNAGNGDAFILKFDNNGNRLWATYYGGSDLESGLSVCTDRHGNIFIAGLSYSTNFPLLNAGTFFQGNTTSSGNNQGYILKFSNTGTRLWATGFKSDRLNAIASDQNGNIYVAGFTYNTTHTLNPGGGAYSQSPGGGGADAVCAKFDNAGNFLWGSYYGGTKQDYGKSIVADKMGNMFMSGITRSRNLPVVGEGNVTMDTISSNSPVETDAFIVKFGPTSNLLWATYCGSQGYDEMSSFDNLAVDGCNRVYMSFEASGTGAITYSACEGGYLDNNNSSTDQFIIRFSNTGVRQWASYVGGDGPDGLSPLAVDSKGELYMAGTWDKNTGATTSYPFLNPGNGAYFNNSFNGTTDAFITRFNGSTVTEPAGFSYPLTCSGSSTSVLPIFTNTFSTGGSFSGPSVLNINPLTGQVFSANAPAGTYTINYYREACQCYASKTILTVVVCPVIGIKEYEDVDQLFINSNPNNGEFVVKGTKAMQLSFCNELGQEIKNVSLSGANDFQAIFSDLLPGVYFLNAANSNITHKIIVIK